MALLSTVVALIALALGVGIGVGLATELGVALLVYFWDTIVRWRRARADAT